MRLNATRLGSIASSRSFGDQLDDLAGQVPNLDLNFAQNKSLIDDYSGTTLVTHTRASSGTYVGSDGVLRSAVTNLLLRSEEFNDAIWGKTNSSISANSTTSPNGTVTADTLVEDSSSATHPVLQSFNVTAGVTYTLSCYVKAAGRNFTQLLFIGGFASNITAIFSLTDGSVGTTGGAPVTTAVNAGNGWYRVSITATATTTTATSVQLRPAITSSSANYLGDGTSGIYLWGAQLEQASSVGEYIPTTSAINSAPRFDHNPTTGESLGLLVEEARTNNHLRSEDVPNWGTPQNATVTANAAIAPDGTTTADALIENTATAEHFISAGSFNFSYVSGTVYTRSCWLKSAGRTFGTLYFPAAAFTNRIGVFNLSTGTVASADAGVTASITPYPNGWYRCSITVAATTTGSAHLGGSAIYLDAGTNSYTGDGTSGILIWGAQLEAGAFATSYIPTTSATVTRAADVASITGANFSSWYNQTEGTFYSENRIGGFQANNYPNVFNANDGINNNVINNFRLDYAIRYTYSVTSGGVAQTGFSQSAVIAAGAVAKMATAVATNNGVLVVNGTEQGADSSLTMPTSINRLQIPGGGDMTIRRLCYWPTRLSNTTLQQITQP
jgi:hypothetical protein